MPDQRIRIAWPLISCYAHFVMATTKARDSLPDLRLAPVMPARYDTSQTLAAFAATQVVQRVTLNRGFQERIIVAELGAGTGAAAIAFYEEAQRLGYQNVTVVAVEPSSAAVEDGKGTCRDRNILAAEAGAPGVFWLKKPYDECTFDGLGLPSRCLDAIFVNPPWGQYPTSLSTDDGRKWNVAEEVPPYVFGGPNGGTDMILRFASTAAGCHLKAGAKFFGLQISPASAPDSEAPPKIRYQTAIPSLVSELGKLFPEIRWVNNKQWMGGHTMPLVQRAPYVWALFRDARKEANGNFDGALKNHCDWLRRSPHPYLALILYMAVMGREERIGYPIANGNIEYDKGLETQPTIGDHEKETQWAKRIAVESEIYLGLVRAWIDRQSSSVVNEAEQKL